MAEGRKGVEEMSLCFESFWQPEQLLVEFFPFKIIFNPSDKIKHQSIVDLSRRRE